MARHPPISGGGGGGGSSAATGPRVLRFTGAQHLNLGQFHPGSTALERGFCYEGLVKINTFATGYWFSTGYGGKHVPLIGFAGDQASGNCGEYDGATETDVQFGSDEAVVVGEWVHVEVVGDGSGRVIVYMWGIPCGISDFTKAQRYWPAGTANKYSFIGAAGGHNGFQGDVARVRIWDRECPYDPSTTYWAHYPERYDVSSAFEYGGTEKICDFIMDVDKGGFLDLSRVGLTTRGSPWDGKHNGAPFHPNYGGEQQTAGSAAIVSGPLAPTIVTDSTCPNQKAFVSITQASRTPRAVPSGALVWDSFQRADQHWGMAERPSLGSTEGGSLGALAWNGLKIINGDTNRQDFWGIWKGYAACLAKNQGAAAYVTHASWPTSYKVTVKACATRVRKPAATGFCFRVQDANNMGLAWTEDGTKLVFGQLIGGSLVAVDGGGFPTLNIGSAWDSVGVYVNNATNVLTPFSVAAGVETTYATINGQTTLTGQKGAGLAAVGGDRYTAGFVRYTDFRVDP